MFNPRGNMHPRPRGPNASDTNPREPFRGPRQAGFQGQRPTGPRHGAPQQFMGREMGAGFSRTDVQVTQHRMDPRQAREQTNQQKEEGHTTHWDNNPFPHGNSQNQPASGSTSIRGRYTNESASSILASFGLSNEDLEELSRYPDDQLTPENMPLILRDIRMRKMGHQLPSLPAQSREKETFCSDEGRGSVVKSKVIDYGHESKYGYSEGPLDVKVYNSDVATEDTMKGFQAQQTVPVPPTPSGVPNNPINAVEELIRQLGFPKRTPDPPNFFVMDAANKMPGLCLPPTGPGVPATAPPMMPPMVPPMPQPMMPPGPPPMPPPPMPPPPLPQAMMPAMNQPPPHFAPAMLESAKRHDRIQHESRPKPPNVPHPPPGGQKNFQKVSENPIESPFGVVKASWLPVFSQADAQKLKRLPTPSMMNDYYAASPKIFPHMCSLCNVECKHLKGWIQHQNAATHIESCRQLRQQYPDWNPEAHSSSKRRGRDRQDTHAPRRHSASPSPKRSRFASSSHARHRSRSRSPGYRGRPRSRSPRRFPSPRHRSRSPWRPLNSGSRSTRSSSKERGSGRSTRSADKALEAVVKCLGPRFVEQFNKQKSQQGAGRGASGPRRMSPEPGKTLGNVKKNASGPAVPQKTSKREPISFRIFDAKAKQLEAGDVPNKGEVAVEGKKKKLPMGAPAKDTSVATPPPPCHRLLTDKVLSCGTVLHISDLPDDGYTDQDIEKIVLPFGKVSDFVVFRSKNEAYLEMNYKEAVIAAVKYGETVPVLVNGRCVKISVAEKPKPPPSQPQNKGNGKKVVQNVTKPPVNTKKEKTNSAAKISQTAPPVTPAAKPHEKKAGESQKAGVTKAGIGQKKAENPVKSKGTKTPVEQKKPADPKKTEVAKKPAVTSKMTGAKKTAESKATDTKKTAQSKATDTKKTAESKATDTKKTAESKATDTKKMAASKATDTKKTAESKATDTKKTVDSKATDTKKTAESKATDTKKTAESKATDSKKTVDSKAKETKNPTNTPDTAEAVQSTEAGDLVPKGADETCVVVISNLPEAGISLDEISNLVKPFGGLKDVLILSSHKKAYLEITQKSADSLVKFYSCFPMWVETSKLCITLAPEFKDLKDEEAIFIAMIKDANPKANLEALHSQFVHLGNLPDRGYSELEILCVGLRFGRVDHYMVISNKKKAILQLDSAESAASMCRFLKRYPYILVDKALTFSRSPKIEPFQVDTARKEVRKQEPSKESPDLKKNPEGTGLVPTASLPSAKPTEAKEEPSSKSKVATTEVKNKNSKKTECKAPSKPSKTVTSEDKLAESATKPVDSSSSDVKSEKELALASNLGDKETVTDKANVEALGNASTSAAGDKDKESADPAELSKESECTSKTGGPGASPAKTEQGVETAPATCETVPLGSTEAPVEKLSGEDSQSDTKLVVEAPGTDHTDTSGNPPETSASEAGVMADKEPENPSSATEASTEAEPEAAVLETAEAAEDKPELQMDKVEAASEKQPEAPKSSDKAAQEEKVEKKADDRSPEQSLPKSQPSKETGQDQPEESPKESGKASVLATELAPSSEATSVSKTILKALMSVPDISKKRTVTRRKEERKPAIKPGAKSGTVTEKKHAPKETSLERPTSSRSDLPDSKSKLRPSSLVVKVGSGKSSSQQDKDSQVETKGSSKQTQEQEARPSATKSDSSKEKVFAGRNTRSSDSGTTPKEEREQEEELFPFNLDEFVTVDEVTDEVDTPSQPRRNPLRGKRKEPAHEPPSKRRKGKTSVAHAIPEQELSFVTLDEIGEDEGGVAQTAEDEGGVAQAAEHLEAIPDPQALVTVDEVNDEEELISEVARDPQALVTLDEISDQEDLVTHGTLKEADGEPDLKPEPLVTEDEPLVTEDEPSVKVDESLVTVDEPLVTVDEPLETVDEPLETVDEPLETVDEPLVTVDEIGEVEELPLNEPSDFTSEIMNDSLEEQQVLEDPEDLLSSQMPEDPSVLFTVDEIQEENDDQPLVTLDEVTEEDDDFLDGELNFVTVDEIGSEDEEEEEEEVTATGTDTEELVAVAAPEKETDAGVGAAEPRESLLLDVKQEEMVILDDAFPGEREDPEEDLPEENKASEAEMEVAEKESAAAEIDTQETTGIAAEETTCVAAEMDTQDTTLVETEKDEGEKDLEQTVKEETEVEAQREPPFAESTWNTTEQPDNQGSNTEDNQQPSEAELAHEEDTEAKAIGMDVDGGSEPVTHEEAKAIEMDAAGCSEPETREEAKAIEMDAAECSEPVTHEEAKAIEMDAAGCSEPVTHEEAKAIEMDAAGCSEPETHEEAKAIEMDAAGCSEPVTPHKEQPDDVVAAAAAPEVSAGDSQATGSETPEAGSEQLGKDASGKEESGSEATPSQSSEKPEKELAGPECEGQESEQRTADSSEKSSAPDNMEDLDFLVPKAGFFCQICSCFCVDEASMKSHCQSALHQQNKKKFMNKKAGEEERKEGDGDSAKVSSR